MEDSKASHSVSSQMTRALLFDAGNTLVKMNYAAIRERLASLGVKRSLAEVIRSEYRARIELDKYFCLTALDRIQTVAECYFGHLLRDLEVYDASVCAMMGHWRKSYNAPLGLWDTADAEAEAVLRDLRTRGVITGVISNSDGHINEILHELGLDKYLDLIVDSHLVGFEKPDQRIFQSALDTAGVSADQAVYIGDLYSVDVIGARNAGMRAILLDPGEMWGGVDSAKAPGLHAAVRLAIEGLDS